MDLSDKSALDLSRLFVLNRIFFYDFFAAFDFDLILFFLEIRAFKILKINIKTSKKNLIISMKPPNKTRVMRRSPTYLVV